MPRFGPSALSRVSDPGSPMWIVSPRLVGILRTTTSEEESRWKHRSASLVSAETPAPLPCAPNRTLLQIAAVTARMRTLSSTPPRAAMIAEGLLEPDRKTGMEVPSEPQARQGWFSCERQSAEAAGSLRP